MPDLANMPKEKQRLVTIGLVVVIVGIVGWLLYANVFAGGGAEAPPPDAPMMPESPGLVPPAGPQMPGGAPPPPGPTPGQPAPEQPSPAAPAPAPSAPSPQPQSAPAPSAASPAQKTITLFGSVTVTYPDGWGVGMGTSGSSAVLTDGKGRFEVHSPDPKANDAKSIASAAVIKLTGKAPGSLAQGALKISGYDAYYYMVGEKRIVGVDAPTRIVLVQYAKGAPFSAYIAAFDKMQSGLSFR